jgi:uncharacterized protein YndB with AHSA1/START domain
MSLQLPTIDPTLDLVLDRAIDVPVDLVWKVWTEPEHLKHWFTPAPWSTVSAEVDLRPGGKFAFVMRSPEGEEFPNEGCFLEVVPGRRLVWTDTLRAGYRPAANPFFTAHLLLEPTSTGTRYVAIAMHGDEATRLRHEEMGFHDGWGKALEQMVEYIKGMGS